MTTRGEKKSRRIRSKKERHEAKKEIKEELEEKELLDNLVKEMLSQFGLGLGPRIYLKEGIGSSSKGDLQRPWN